jgi:8-oxo-dGTP pyrophosphatase MutT (NUDIX family)
VHQALKIKAFILGYTQKQAIDAIPGGLADDRGLSEFSAEDLGEGLEVESEHTANAQIASEIARDHLTEDPEYYEKLEEMEKKAKEKSKKDKKISKVMREFKAGTLNSGSKDGPIVKDKDQAIAIALSEAEGVEKEAYEGWTLEDVAEDLARSEVDLIHGIGSKIKKGDALKGLRGYDPKKGTLDMKENLRGTYGKALDKELGKASQYSKKKKLPFDMGKGYNKKVKVVVDKSRYPYWIHNPKSESGMLLPSDPSVTNMALETQYPKLKITDNSTQQSTRHEMAHAATISGDPETAHKKLAIPEKKYKTNPSIFDKHLIENARDTYPELSGPETIPPLAAIQQHLFETTGKRIESPEEYDAYVKKLDALPLEDRQKLPIDVQRFMMYRDKMRDAANQNWGSLEIEPEWYRNLHRERLKRYDDYNRSIIPGIVKSLKQRINKQAAVTATTKMTKPTARPRCTNTTCPPESFASYETASEDPMRIQRPTQKSEQMMGESESVQGKQDYKSPELKINFTDPEEEMEKESRDETVKLTYHESHKLPYRQRSEVFAIDPESGEVVCRMKRSNAGGLYVELPGGGIDKGESPETAVKREAMEEAGITLKNIELVGTCRWKWPTKHKEAMTSWAEKYAGDDSYIFIAEVDTKGKPTSEEGDAWEMLLTKSIPKLRAFLESHKQNGLTVMQDCRLAALKKLEARANI